MEKDSRKKYLIICGTVVGLFGLLVTLVLISLKSINTDGWLLAISIIAGICLIFSFVMLLTSGILKKSSKEAKELHEKKSLPHPKRYKSFILAYLTCCFFCAVFAITYLATLDKNGFFEYLTYALLCIFETIISFSGMVSYMEWQDLIVGFGLIVLIVGVFLISNYIPIRKKKNPVSNGIDDKHAEKNCNKLMFIKEIINPEYHGYNVIAEADVVVTDGENELLCYHYDINNNVEIGMKITNILAVNFGEANVMRAQNCENIIEKDKKDHFGYCHMQGELIDREKSIVKIGNLVLDLSACYQIDKDIMQGEYIEFKVDRFDIVLDESDVKIRLTL